MILFLKLILKRQNGLYILFVFLLLYEGEAEFYCHWPLMDLLLTEEHENELCLQLSGSSSTYQSEVEEEVPCQVSLKQISFYVSTVPFVSIFIIALYFTLS